MARVGVDGVNIHTFPGAAYQLFTFAGVHGRWRAAVEPDYYGLDMFAQAAPAGSRLLKVSADRARAAEGMGHRGAERTIRVVLINEGTRAASRLRAPRPVRPFARLALVARVSATAAGTLERLEAPSIARRDG